MASVNKVILIGNLGQDPEVRTLDNGTKVARLSLATSETYKDKNSGERITNTEWHNVTLWKGLAEVAENYLKKGDSVYIEGSLQTKSYEKDGITRYATQIVGKQLTMLGGNKQSDDMEGAQNRDMGQQQAAPSNETDDLPF